MGGFLSQRSHIQQALGVPFNYTQFTPHVNIAFYEVGDVERSGWKENLEELLDAGIKVYLMYGDRDYSCNWYGGEAVSLALEYG